MTDPLEKLKAKKAEILEAARREAEAVDADLRELERLQSLANKYGLSLAPKEIETPKRPAPDVQTDFLGPTKEPAYLRAIKSADKLVRIAGHPLQFTEIYDWVVADGVPLAGKRPQSTLSAYLSHEKSTLESIRKGWYWLKGVPIPPN